MKYKIVTVNAVIGSFSTEFEQAAEKLSNLVNREMRDGWMPVGGVAVGQTMSTKEPYLFQAMTHE